MAGLLDDPVYKVIQEGIKEDIEITLKHERYRITVMLIYAGMDSMAWLGMPANQHDVKGEDFIRWADRYIRFPCKDQITGEELYGARCALLHSSGIESRRSRDGKCRMVGYANQCVPEVRFAPIIDTSLIIVSIRGLKDAFFTGINKFLIDSFSNSERRLLVEARIEKMVQTFPFTETR
jgi:hypothetical protein